MAPFFVSLIGLTPAPFPFSVGARLRFLLFAEANPAFGRQAMRPVAAQLHVGFGHRTVGEAAGQKPTTHLVRMSSTA